MLAIKIGSDFAILRRVVMEKKEGPSPPFCDDSIRTIVFIYLNKVTRPMALLRSPLGILAYSL